MTSVTCITSWARGEALPPGPVSCVQHIRSWWDSGNAEESFEKKGGSETEGKPEAQHLYKPSRAGAPKPRLASRVTKHKPTPQFFTHSGFSLYIQSNIMDDGELQSYSMLIASIYTEA